jgi:hypothetical protein
MNVGDFSEMAHGIIEVRSAYNDKLLCRDFNPNKHKEIAIREITSVWSEIRTFNGIGFGNIAKPILCTYVVGDKEYEEDLIKKGSFKVKEE